MQLVNRLGKAVGVAAGVLGGIREGLRAQPAVLVDIGARGGLARSWHPMWSAGLTVPVFFEPDPAAASVLEQRYPAPAIIVRKGAWSAPARRTLHITAEPGGSSILVPAPDARMSVQMQDLLRLARTLEVDLVTARAALLELGVTPEIVKIDVQGGELEVLKGFGALLEEVVCCELEVSFMRGYVDQPLFQDVFDFMLDAGFGLFDLDVFGVAATRSGVQANARFCRRALRGPREQAIEALFVHASQFRTPA